MQRPQVDTIQPQQVESDVGGAARAPKQVVKLWTAGFVGRDHFAVEYSLIHAELRHLAHDDDVDAFSGAPEC